MSGERNLLEYMLLKGKSTVNKHSSDTLLSEIYDILLVIIVQVIGYIHFACMAKEIFVPNSLFWKISVSFCYHNVIVNTRLHGWHGEN